VKVERTVMMFIRDVQQAKNDTIFSWRATSSATSSATSFENCDNFHQDLQQAGKERFFSDEQRVEKRLEV